MATDIKSVSRRVDMLEEHGVKGKISENQQTSSDKKKLGNEKVAKDKPTKEITKKPIVKNDQAKSGLLVNKINSCNSLSVIYFGKSPSSRYISKYSKIFQSYSQ